MEDTVILWTAFNLFVLGMLALDLGVFHKRSEEITVRNALVWTGIWITLAMAPLDVLGEALDNDTLRAMKDWTNGATRRDGA